jgi:hypothetical protein
MSRRSGSSDTRFSRPLGLRRVVIFGAPLLGYFAALLHPHHLMIGQDPWVYIGVHLALPLIICLLAWMILFLVEGIDNAAATVARVLAIPFAVAYTLFTAFGGVAVGAFVWKTNELPAAEQLQAATLIHSVSHSALAHPLYLAATLLWLAVMLAVVAALWGRAPLPALVLVALGAAAFARSHVRPWGPAGMAAVLAGVVWLELKPGPASESRRDDEPGAG